MIDSNTVSAILGGDPQAFEKVYLQTHDKAYSIAYRILKDEYEAEDIVQDAYLTMIEKLCDLKEAERLEGWFYRIVQNGAKDNLRKRHAEVFTNFDNDEEDFQFSDTIVSDYAPFDPEATADYEELKRIMDGFVMGLPEMQRKCILLRFRGDKKISEIAQMLGIPEATVKSNLNYGKRKIEGEVRALEKQGVKLYSLTPVTAIAFLRWMWGQSSSTKAAAIYLAGTAAAASGSVAAGAAGAAAAGAAGKIGIALTAKQIAAGIIAAVAIAGGATAIAKPELFTSLFAPNSAEVFLEEPTEESAEEPTEESTEEPTEESTEEPTEESTEEPTEESTEAATEESTEAATEEPTEESTEAATEEPTEESTEATVPTVTKAQNPVPTPKPTVPTQAAPKPTTPKVTEPPTQPTTAPTEAPATQPTTAPTEPPTLLPTEPPAAELPAEVPTEVPATEPTVCAHNIVFGSSVLATCISDGYGSRYCSYCGYSEEFIIPATGHDFQLSSHQDPDFNVNGWDIYTCTKCGWMYKNTIPGLDAEDNKWCD